MKTSLSNKNAKKKHKNTKQNSHKNMPYRYNRRQHFKKFDIEGIFITKKKYSQRKRIQKKRK